jgi:hypothetical protein
MNAKAASAAVITIFESRTIRMIPLSESLHPAFLLMRRTRTDLNA